MNIANAKRAAEAFSAHASDPGTAATIVASYAFHFSLIQQSQTKLCQACGRFLLKRNFSPRKRGSRDYDPRCNKCHTLEHISRRPTDHGRRCGAMLSMVKAQRISRFFAELQLLRAEHLTSAELATLEEGIGQVRRRFADGRGKLAAWKYEAEARGVETPVKPKRRHVSQTNRRRK